MTKYEKKKKTHKCDTKNFTAEGWATPFCRIHNKTWAYRMVRSWRGVSCENCLKHKKRGEK